MLNNSLTLTSFLSGNHVIQRSNSEISALTTETYEEETTITSTTITSTNSLTQHLVNGTTTTKTTTTKATTRKPLNELTINEVQKLLEITKLTKFKNQFLENEVDGDTLCACLSPEDIKELGVTFLPKCRLFLNRLRSYEEDGGVPFTHIGYDDVVDQDVVVENDVKLDIIDDEKSVSSTTTTSLLSLKKEVDTYERLNSITIKGITFLMFIIG